MTAAPAQTQSLAENRRSWYLRLMAREFGCVSEDRRPNGRVYWRIDCRVDGHRYKLRGYHTRGGKRILFKCRGDAQEALDEIRSDLRRGIPQLQAVADFLPYGAPEMTFERHYRRFTTTKARQGRDGRGRQISDKRIEELRGHESRGHLNPLLGVSIHSVNYGVLEDWRDWLFDARGLSPGSVRHLIADVGTFLHWLRKRREIAEMPELPDVQVPEYAPKIPTPEAQDRILEAIPWEKRGAFLVRGLMGLRPSEACRANDVDYDFDRDLLTVHAKGGKVRFLPAPKIVAGWIHEHIAQPSHLRATDAPPRPLFPNPKATNPEGRWTPAAARRVMLDAYQKTGLRFKPNEALRHCFATDAANRGVGLDRVGHYLGHSSPKTTERYAKLAGERLTDVPRGPKGPHVVPTPKSGS